MQLSVVVLGHLRFSAEHLAEVLPHLKQLVDATRRDDGCLAYDVAVDPFDPGLIRFSELWPDHDTLAKHLKAPHIEPWRAVARRLGLIERHFVAYDVSGSRAV